MPAPMTLKFRLNNKFEVYTLIDEADFDTISKGKWYAIPQGKGTKNFRVKGRLGSQKLIYLHRFITKAPSNLVVDHINGNPLDNRRDNLRIVTKHINQQNRKQSNKNSKTGIRGICKTRYSYKVQLEINNKRYYKQGFKTLEEAKSYLDRIIGL